ncbi:MAG: UDP-N-acetylmuramate dehydrogenase [Candidatus Omnitrophica bacterium]|nr:UDP-N-acetylmuramate dehydrogenase [Candidatus Omnitrophota bacterium]MBU4334484.1 UDP-N-acetylmuramate dehydrogenase [Candidatus Omnitrophota bacterium]
MVEIKFPQNLSVNIQYDSELAPFTTFKLGGKAKGIIRCSTPQQLQNVVDHLIKNISDFIVIGGGSNIVVSDAGVNCFVIRYFSDIPFIERQNDDVVVFGSTKLEDLVSFSVDQGLGDLSFASGIPGTVGGAICGNAGAFGKQISEYLRSVSIITRSGELKEFDAEELCFDYRDSILKRTQDIVLSARFSLLPYDKDILTEQRVKVLGERRKKHPDWKKERCAGSFFKNVDCGFPENKRKSAGCFLDEVGAKDLRVNGAYVFEKHANIIMVDDAGKAQDIFDLSSKMDMLVKEKFDFQLEREVRFVGDFLGKPKEINNVIW